ncbi:hypothetical protein OH799_00540 [Nocardia sp. NBC_00881]|uniref:hypothetical protein n=1 Tax=Nocardia sp. NBC_00881 TaxID=2975995 RepID=UPI00386985EF|nr:hypothetical protein OH799_00540 [Nocardia sp. NBC_00881]
MLYLTGADGRQRCVTSTYHLFPIYHRGGTRVTDRDEFESDSEYLGTRLQSGTVVAQDPESAATKSALSDAGHTSIAAALRHHARDFHRPAELLLTC